MCRGPMLYGAITRAGLKVMVWCLFCAQLKTFGQPVKTLGEEGKNLKEQNQQLIEEQRKRGRVVDECQTPLPHDRTIILPACLGTVPIKHYSLRRTTKQASLLGQAMQPATLPSKGNGARGRQ